MIDMPIPEIRIIKNSRPILYLDTCVLIELSRYEKGVCKNEHIDKIGALYNFLVTAMREKRILCVLGNQLEEMGTSQNRESAREFLFRFTNVEFASPYHVEKVQMEKGYQAFVWNMSTQTLNVADIIEHPEYVSNSSIEIHAVPIYTQERMIKLKEDKQKLATTLNDVKNRRHVAENYDAQLALELESDIQVFKYNLEHTKDSWETCMITMDALKAIYRRVGIDPCNSSDDDKLKAVVSHNKFLISPYHHKLPRVWIRSVLFAHLMQRQNKIIPSDNLDIMWASAYLPFVDYVVTDSAFCNLLNQSSLADQYGTKVYSFRTLENLLKNFVPVAPL